MNKKELKARIEEEEKILQFFARYEKEFIEFHSKPEWEIGVDDTLDVLIDLYQLLKRIE